MKGVLFLHLRSFLDEAYPRVSWQHVLSECGIAQMFAGGWDYPDRMMTSIVNAVCRAQHVAHDDLWYRFGRHSMGEFRKNYHWYFDQNPDTRALLLSINSVHADAVKHITGANPPRFVASLSDDRQEIVLAYRSDRDMVDYLRGAVDGVLAIYREKADVRIVRREAGEATLHIRFS